VIGASISQKTDKAYLFKSFGFHIGSLGKAGKQNSQVSVWQVTKFENVVKLYLLFSKYGFRISKMRYDLFWWGRAIEAKLKLGKISHSRLRNKKRLLMEASREAEKTLSQSYAELRSSRVKGPRATFAQAMDKVWFAKKITTNNWD